MLYCCSSTRAKYSMARMDSLSFRVRTMSWNDKKNQQLTPLRQTCFVPLHWGQRDKADSLSQICFSWENKQKYKSCCKNNTLLIKTEACTYWWWLTDLFIIFFFRNSISQWTTTVIANPHCDTFGGNHTLASGALNFKIVPPGPTKHLTATFTCVLSLVVVLRKCVGFLLAHKRTVLSHFFICCKENGK